MLDADISRGSINGRPLEVMDTFFNGYMLCIEQSKYTVYFVKYDLRKKSIIDYEGYSFHSWDSKNCCYNRRDSDWVVEMPDLETKCRVLKCEDAVYTLIIVDDWSAKNFSFYDYINKELRTVLDIYPMLCDYDSYKYALYVRDLPVTEYEVDTKMHRIVLLCSKAERGISVKKFLSVLQGYLIQTGLLTLSVVHIYIMAHL